MIFDYSLIKNVTENLSDVIFDAYDETAGEIAKGRAVGTDGERYAATEIIKQKMIDIGLTNPGLEPSYLEPLEDIDYFGKLESGNIDITTKLEVLNRSLSIKNETTGETQILEDYYISPR